MLGRFLGYDGTDENKPTARFGHLSMSPTVPIPHPYGFTQPSFLIECGSVSGYSGSPVFVYRVQATVAAGFMAIGSDRGECCPAQAVPQGIPCGTGELFITDLLQDDYLLRLRFP